MPRSKAVPIQLFPPLDLVAEKPEFLIGVDLGKSQDYSAVAVMECRGTGRRIYKLRHLERYQLFTPYQQVAKNIKELMRNEHLRQYDATVVADATGVGKPVMEMFRDEGLAPVEVTITHGFSVNKARRALEFNVAKSVLVSAVNLVIQDGRLKVAPSLPLAKTFVQEANKFKTKKTASGEASYEAWRERDHDDLVLAVAIALWYGESEMVTVPGLSPAVKRARERGRPGGPDGRNFFGQIPKPRQQRRTRRARRG